jgi:dihydroorotate dehydrogenase (fumarate)
MTDLHTRYLGLELRSPLIASSSPLTGSLASLRELESAGAGAVVLPSLFEEDLAGEAGGSALAAHLSLVELARAELSIPVIASLNDLVRAVRRTVRIPVAVKVSPYFSAMANMARRLVEAGANGLVLFNRFYQPDLDIEALDVVPGLPSSTLPPPRQPGFRQPRHAATVRITRPARPAIGRTDRPSKDFEYGDGGQAARGRLPRGRQPCFRA